MARIAWVEDDAHDIQDVVKPLKQAGHEIHTYASFREALDYVAELRRADLLLLDILVPSGDPGAPNDDLSAGLKLLVELRRLNVSGPAVVFSARGRGQHENELTAEMDIRDWIQKPVSRYELAERVEAVITTARGP